MAKRKSKDKRRHAFFIFRKSEIDNTLFFNDGGRRIWFEKAVHARPLMVNFAPEQKARIVYGPVLDNDVAYRGFLTKVLPDEMTPDEYLAAIEKTAADAKRGRDVSPRAARRFLKQQRRRFAAVEEV
ncbi:MAG: hypothetical protein ACTSX8_05820 [Alphaproteobacteria bacterium]